MHFPHNKTKHCWKKKKKEKGHKLHFVTPQPVFRINLEPGFSFSVEVNWEHGSQGCLHTKFATKQELEQEEEGTETGSSLSPWMHLYHLWLIFLWFCSLGSSCLLFVCWINVCVKQSFIHTPMVSWLLQFSLVWLLKKCLSHSRLHCSWRCADGDESAPFLSVLAVRPGNQGGRCLLLSAWLLIFFFPLLVLHHLIFLVAKCCRDSFFN